MRNLTQQAASVANCQKTSLPGACAGRPTSMDDTRSLLKARKAKRGQLTRQPKRVGPYLLLRRLGAGGMGEVFLARHRMLGRLCAVKLIRPEHKGDGSALARFTREAQTTARLAHWNTAQVYDYGKTRDGCFYYAMEYLPGLNLEEMLREDGPLPAERVVHLLRQVCQSLREAHALGLVHRDVKPANVIVTERGGLYDVAKLLDFGLVKPSADAASPRLTQDGAISGTPLFMSPEQARDADAVDARSDIYSLGAVAYALLTGRPPFEGKTPVAVILAHAYDEVTPPSRLNPGVPADLEAVVLRCLAKLPDERIQCAADLEEALARCADAEKWTQSQAARWWQERAQTTATKRKAVNTATI